MKTVERIVVEDADALAREALVRVLATACEALTRRGRFDLVLCGGSTPEPLYRALSRLPRATFEAWHLWWGDERCVPHDHPDSNFGMVAGTLLSEIPWEPGRVHPIPTVSVTPDEAAHLYQQDIVAQLGTDVPRFDLVLLGLGEDGHTASLFPGSPALDVNHALVTSAEEHAGHERVTLTLPALDAARNVLFLVSGPDKRDVLARVLALSEPSPRYPASLVRSRRGATTWLVDRGAAPEGL